MGNMNDLGIVITALALGVTNTSNAQSAAFQRKNTRLAGLNVQAGAVVAGTVLTATVGQPFDMPMYFVPGPGNVAGLQFDLILPAGFSFISVTAGPVMTAAQKQVQVNAAINRVLVVGFNQTTLSEGNLLTVRLATQSSVPRAIYPIVVTNMQATNPQGTNSTLSGMSIPVTLQ